MKVGDRVEVEVSAVAHGGHFVARHEERVIFVRHALPGESVAVRITEDHGRFLRGDAIDVLRASADRVQAPCALAKPDGCGGCDFQHVALPAQRELKAAVLAEQLRRLAGLDVDVEVEPVAGDENGLRWRTRMQYVAVPGRRGEHGLRKHRSHDVVPVADCLIARPDAREPTTGTLTEQVGEHTFSVAADGFWQVHPGAPRALVEAVLGQLDVAPGERAVDLYAGVGLFSAFLAEAVGPDGSVQAIEGDRRAAELAGENLAAYPWARMRHGRVDRLLPHLRGGADVVVLDPPRAGAKRKVVDLVAGLGPRAISYVACDPAALARDLAYFADAGYALTELRAFDLFPMTHHVECVALLTKTGSDLR